MNRRRVSLSLAAATGGILAAAFLPAAIASADIVDLFTPDTSTFDPATGAEDWNYIFLPDASQDVLDGFTTKDTVETFGSIVNNYATVTGFTTGPEVGSDIDYLQLGGGFANEFVYEPGVSPTITDLLITPFGDFTLLG